jgi:tetratricopeptide (TPR) repeat protein
MQLTARLNRSCLYVALAAIVATCSLPAPSAAYDRLGTAGFVRTFGGSQCARNYAAASSGACDPPEVSASLPAEKKIEARVERARTLISVLRTKQAIEELNAAVGEDPAATSALLLRGRLALPDRREDALKDISAVLRIEPSNPDALATRALMLIGLQDDIALRDVTKAISIKPDDVDALLIRAMVLVRQGNLAGANEDLDRALAIEPDHPDALLSRAQLRFQAGDSPAAERDSAAVLSMRDDARARQIRAVALVKAGKFAEALEDIDAALGPPEKKESVGSTNPRQFVDLLVQRALILSRLGRKPEAKIDLGSIGPIGGRRAVLQMQLYLRNHGFEEIALDGKQSDSFDDALILCFINDVCAQGFTIPG